MIKSGKYIENADTLLKIDCVNFNKLNDRNKTSHIYDESRLMRFIAT